MSVIKGNCKEYKGFTYPITFPEEWIINELQGTGRECLNCVGKHKDGYAMWRGVILGYCCNCANDYNYERGPGFYSHGCELVSRCPMKSAYITYLKGIHLDEIGNLSVNPMDTLENHENTKNDISKHRIS